MPSPRVSTTTGDLLPVKAVAVRLRPGEDLKTRIEAVVREEGIGAGVILSGVGSVRSAVLRLADGKIATTFPGPFEIVSLIGTVGAGGVHLHMVVADGEGHCRGGHLMPGNEIHTTCELVIGVMDDFRFDREKDPATGFPELVMRPK